MSCPKAWWRVEADADIEDALKVLLIEKFGCLPVIEKKKLVGILTDTDLLEYCSACCERANPKRKGRERTAEPHLPSP